MTMTERAEAELLVANGMLHARMLPLLSAALEECHPFDMDQALRLELAQLLCEIGVQADMPQQDELFRFVKAKATGRD